MLVRDKSLGQRFAGYTDEELLRILTVERAQYRRVALEAAETELMRRGVAPPAPPPVGAPEPEVPEPGSGQEQNQPKSPYQLVDLFVDVVLFGLAFWSLDKLEGGPLLPGAGFLDGVVRGLLATAVCTAALWLRHRWRAKEWRD
ncbi:MAG TPA: hypothetical protein VG148_00570 [Pyrinomonadaceae bacterium]|nr:hypothetical protein [Pyrinomonadaceae bacterium]